MSSRGIVLLSGGLDSLVSLGLGIKDYGTVRVVSYGIIADTPRKYSKKVLVTLDSIDGEGNVTVLCFRNKITLL